MNEAAALGPEAKVNFRHVADDLHKTFQVSSLLIRYDQYNDVTMFEVLGKNNWQQTVEAEP